MMTMANAAFRLGRATPGLRYLSAVSVPISTPAVDGTARFCSLASRCRRQQRRAIRCDGRPQRPPFDEYRRQFATLRRKRRSYGKYNDEGKGLLVSRGLDAPFRYSGKNLEEYSEKATLSPWTPVPESVARRMMDIAAVTAEDVHVELGCGDGRVNFFAIEHGAEKSIGIDVDEDIVKVANDRLMRIHPRPSIEFVVADLMDPDHSAWKHVEEATVLTMYFASEGLTKLKPLIERRLTGKRCKVLTCGYPMPGWDYQMAETVLDIPIHFYDWGNDEISNFFHDSMVDEVPMDYEAKQLDQYLRNRKRNSSNFVPDPLPGYHPTTHIEEEEDDDDDIHANDNDNEGRDDAAKSTVVEVDAPSATAAMNGGDTTQIGSRSIPNMPKAEWKPNK